MTSVLFQEFLWPILSGSSPVRSTFTKAIFLGNPYYWREAPNVKVSPLSKFEGPFIRQTGGQIGYKAGFAYVFPLKSSKERNKRWPNGGIRIPEGFLRNWNALKAEGRARLSVPQQIRQSRQGQA
jgi:hypothetical protein